MRPIALLAFVPVAAAAYPISPMTLWELSAEAELVVLARVDRVTALEGGDKVAVLDTVQSWKGAPPRSLQVAFDPGVLCPAPARYVEGQRVVAFLKQRKGAWVTVGRSYGVRYPLGEAEELEHADAVKRALAEQVGTSAATERWALATARGRSTRWDGLYALQASADPSKHFYDRSARAAPGVSDAGLGELERLMVAAPSYDRTLVQLLTLLEPSRSAEVTAAAADAVESILNGASAPHWLGEAIDLVEQRLGAGLGPKPVPADRLDADLALLTERWKESAEAREERLQRRWAELKSKHRLAPRVRPDFERERRTGTGAQTPP